MAKKDSNKGNPAHKRMGNAKLKARRASSWLRGQRRKADRTRASNALHAERLANGGLGRRERRRLASGVRKP